jgi:hypothetical protein
MVRAAMSRRAGPGTAVAALAITLMAGSGCGSPAARHAPEQGHLALFVAAVAPKPAIVSLPRVRGRLPWPVALRTADGTYVVARSGAIHWLRPAVRPRAQVHHPAGFIWMNRHAGTWAAMRDGHLVILRNREVIWRSTARYAVRDAAHMADIVIGRPGVVFEVHPFGPWFIATWRGHEHRMAATGWPEMWTRSGNLIGLLHRRGSRSSGYAVFSPSGTRLATLATGLSNSVVDQSYDDPATGTYWYLTGNGDLLRTDGVATSFVASTRALGFMSMPYLGMLRGGLVQLLSASANWRDGQVILYPDGQLFARIPGPGGKVTGFAGLSASPGHRMVAYILTNDSGNGAATIFLVRPGTAPVAVYRMAHGPSPCGPPPLAWHRSWLLYAPHRGNAVIINTAGSHRIVRLPSTLPGGDGRTVRVQAVSWR